MHERVGLGCFFAALLACTPSVQPPGVIQGPDDAGVAAPSDAGFADADSVDSGAGAFEAGAVDAGDLDALSWSPSLDGASDATEPDGGACPASSTPAMRQVLSGEVSQVTMACSVDGGAPPLVGPVPSSTELSLSFSLPVRNQQELDIYVQNVSDPTSPLYRQYLTPAQYTAMFAPTECDYQALIDWLESQGFVVTNTYSDRELVDVIATAAVAGAALHVTFNDYQRSNGGSFYAPDQDPSLDLSVPLLSIDGLDDCQIPVPGK